jgi:Tfp pilus assembly protein PilX
MRKFQRFKNCLYDLDFYPRRNDSRMRGVNYESGQILLISLMVLVVAMVVGLSVATRTVTTLRTTTAEDSSRRAFSAAEAGIERAMTATVNTTFSGNLGNNSDYVTTTSVLSGNSFLVQSGGVVLKNDPADIWLSNYPDYSSPWSGTLTVYWGDATDVCIATPESSNTMAALEVILIRGSRNAPIVNTFAYDPCAGRRNSYNHFSAPSAGGTVAGKAFRYSASIPVNSGLVARIVPLYAGAYFGVTGTNLPSQGTVIESTGSSGGAIRRIISFRGHPSTPPEIYPFLIFLPK